MEDLNLIDEFAEVSTTPHLESDPSSRIISRSYELPEEVASKGVCFISVEDDGSVTVAISDGEKWIEQSESDSIQLAVPAYDPRFTDESGDRPVLRGRQRSYDRWGDDEVHFRHQPAPKDSKSKPVKNKKA